jgi:hypothetical protein
MKMQYNDTDEYNSIRTGNTVYISGLPGKSNSFINNKYGYVEEIFLSCKNKTFNYVAKIVLFSTNESHFVDFSYIFKIGKNLNDLDAKAIIWEENPMMHYKYKKNLVDCHPLQDENGQLLAICNDIYGRKHVFLYSGIN